MAEQYMLPPLVTQAGHLGHIVQTRGRGMEKPTASIECLKVSPLKVLRKAIYITRLGIRLSIRGSKAALSLLFAGQVDPRG